jgi:hypothetical protein
MTGDLKLDAADLMRRSLVGASLEVLEQPAEGVWQFDFVRSGLTIECPWRIVANGAVVLGALDHGHQFGLPVPVDVIEQTLKILNGKTVENIEIGPETADLGIIFRGETRIDVFNSSSGYEGWNFGDREGLSLIALGGGKLAVSLNGRSGVSQNQ